MDSSTSEPVGEASRPLRTAARSAVPGEPLSSNLMRAPRSNVLSALAFGAVAPQGVSGYPGAGPAQCQCSTSISVLRPLPDCKPWLAIRSIPAARKHERNEKWDKQLARSLAVGPKSVGARAGAKQLGLGLRWCLMALCVVASHIASAAYSVTASGASSTLGPTSDTMILSQKTTTVTSGEFVLQTADFSLGTSSRPGTYPASVRQRVSIDGESLDLVFEGRVTVGAGGANREDQYFFDVEPLVFARSNVAIAVVRATFVRKVGDSARYNLVFSLTPEARSAPPVLADPGGTTVADSRTSCPRGTEPEKSGKAGPEKPGKGCTTWTVSAMTVSLSLRDMPVGYRPPLGPAIEFWLYYNQREAQQQGDFSYWNVGPRWSTAWTAFVFDDLAANSRARLAERGGGTEDFPFASPSAITSSLSRFSQSTLVRLTGTGGQTIGFTRHRADGSSEEFRVASGNLYLLSAVVDAAGRRAALNYDTLNRLTSIVDAIGQRTTLAYGGSDPLKLTKVTDPFGRSASFSYNSDGQLASITDVLGIRSAFTYGDNDFITTLITPYGTTRFDFADDSTNPSLGTTRILEVTDALGRTSRYEYRDKAPGVAASESRTPAGMQVKNAELDQRNTFIWNPTQYAAATASGGLDYTKAKIIHWLRSTNVAVVSRVIESTKEPLEARVWYGYNGQTDPSVVGTTNQPSVIGRILGDGRTQLQRFQYNAQGNVTESIDPLGRRTTLTYAANGVDVLTVANTTSGTQTLATVTYNAQHLPLTIRGADGVTRSFEYNAAGQPTRLVDGLGNATTRNYDSSGYLTRIQGPISAAALSFTYDSVGRVATATDPAGMRLQYTYDAADRVTSITFPDRTRITNAYTLLELTSTTDRLGNKTSFAYDAERQRIQTTDALGNKVKLGYSPTGTLSSLTDQRNNETRWLLDLQDRVVSKIYADGKAHQVGYDAGVSWVTSRVDAIGQTASTSYNLDGTVAGVAYLNARSPTASVTYRYDPAYPRVTAMSDEIGSTSYSYYPVGSLGANQLQMVVSPIPGASGSDTVIYGYDALGRVVTRSVNGSVESTSYDSLGRVTRVANALDTFNYGYADGTDRVSAIGSNAGPRAALEYFDPTGNALLKRLTYSASNGSVLSQFGYTYDANLNVTSFTESYINQRLETAAASVSWRDFLGGLSALTVNASTAMSASTVRGPRLPDWVLATAALLLTTLGWQLARLTKRRWVWPAGPVALSLALASCGGGEPQIEHPLAGRPVVATSAQRALVAPAATQPNVRALATGPYNGVDPELAVNQLFDRVAEPNLPRYFPGHKQTQRFGAYRFRYYPETGAYVAVAVGVVPGDGLVEGGVYVLGGPFGGVPVLVGKLLDFYTPTAPSAGNAQVTSYRYDALNRLVAGTVGTDLAPPSGQPKHSYSYDAASNLTSMTVGGVPKTASHNITNGISGVTYDGNGSPVLQDGWTYGWDAANRLIKAINGQAESIFTYDGQSRIVRIVDKQGGTLTSDRSYLWCGMQRCLERDNLQSGSPISKRYFAQGVLASGSPQYYVTDQLGSVRQVASAGGQVLAQYQFDPYGSRTKVSGGVAADMGFAGLFSHGQSGLDLAVFRGYAQGRWLNRDPIGEEGDVNLYQYVSGNPITFIDPMGLFNVAKGVSALGNAVIAGFSAGSGGVKVAIAVGLSPAATTGVGALPPTALLAWGLWNWKSASSAWNRSFQQWREAMCEKSSDASWKNLMGMLPGGTHYDDPGEFSGPLDYIQSKGFSKFLSEAGYF